MTPLFRRIAGFVFSVIAILFAVGSHDPAAASPSAFQKSVIYTDIANVGFLDLKTFLVVPDGMDGELGITSRQVHLISPETLFAHKPRVDLLQSLRRDGLLKDDGSLQVFGKPETPNPVADTDSMTIKVNGEPVTLGLGLEQAMVKDVETNIQTYGNPGVFTGGTGYASAAYLGTMTHDVIRKIETLESAAKAPPTPDPAVAEALATGPVYIIPEPSALSAFAVGLVALGWMARRRRQRG